ncbi:MAG: DNA mismatch repair protein MutS [Anaerolineales bacterium]
MAKESVTPIRKQYLEIKRQYPDEILFFRLGDFYETFDNDAEIAARELDIVLTSRNVAKGTRVPMAGIPHHAAENYISRLIDRGYHVAICEQIGEQPIRGIFPRKVTRVITPGTVTDPGMLPGDQNNYLACIVKEDQPSARGGKGGESKRVGFAYVDITTGEFAVTEFSGEDADLHIKAEISRLKPAELLFPETINLGDGYGSDLTSWPAWRFESGRCEEELLDHFGVASLDGFGLRGRLMGISASGGIIQYLAETQPSSLKLLSALKTYDLSEFMHLDSATRRNLELTATIRGGKSGGTLLDILDRTVTPMGKRLIHDWVSKPLLDVGQISKRQDGVRVFFEDGMLRTELKDLLKSIPDIERLANRIASSIAIPRDLVALRNTLNMIPKLMELLQEQGSALEPVLLGLNPCSEELSLLEGAIAEDPPATLQHSGVIKRGFSDELDGVVEGSRHAREWIAGLEKVERDRTGIKSLKVGYNKVFGYYIEVTRANSPQVPAEYIRKQTLVNSERFITPEMKEYEALVLNAEERIREIEARLFTEICSQLAAGVHRIIGTARAVALLDVYASLAESAVIGGYIQPEVVVEDVLEIKDGRHPVVESYLSTSRFVPNDVVFADGERIRIITGPNMSGKSTLIRQVALLVLMSQIGSFIPASTARIGVVDRIFTRIGAQDEIYAGQSTFMVEMLETASILHHATSRSLIILDEIGRGTSTYDGVSIAWAVVEFIHNHPRLRAKTMFATHFHELTQLAELLPGVRNYNVAVSEADGQVVFLHKVVPGGADRSYGIHVGRLAGLPGPVVQRASQILNQLEASSGRAVKLEPDKDLQLSLFPESSALLDDLDSLDLNSLSPIEALNKLYEWQGQYTKSQKGD